MRFSFPHPLVCSRVVPQFCVTSKMDDDLLSSFNNSGKYQMTIEDHKPAKQTSFSQFTFCSFYSSIPLQEPVSTPWSAYSARIVTSSKAEIGSPGKIDISFVSGGYRLPMPAFDQKYCSLKTIGSNFFFVICKVLNLTSWQDWYQLFIRRLSIANRANKTKLSLE